MTDVALVMTRRGFCLRAAVGRRETIVIYEETRHSVGGGAPSSILEPNVTAPTANSLTARFSDQAFRSERWWSTTSVALLSPRFGWRGFMRAKHAPTLDGRRARGRQQ